MPVQQGQCGLIALIDGNPAGWDLVSRADVYAELHAQLIQSYAMEALSTRADCLRKGDAKPTQTIAAQEPDPMAAKAFLERCAALRGKAYPSVGLGTDWRFIDSDLVGSGLEVEDAWVHMAYFLDEQKSGGEEPSRRRSLPRMSRRSQYRRRDPGEDEQTIY